MRQDIKIADPVVERVRLAMLAMQRKDWEQGMVAQAFLEAGDDEMLVRLVTASLVYSTDDGRLAVLGESGLIDCAMLGEALLRAAEVSNLRKLAAAEVALREYIRTGAARAEDGTLYHTGREHWVDSFNCAVPYLAAAGCFSESVAQIDGLRRRLWNAGRNLYSHIWSDDANALVNDEFWGVGNGWAAVGLARVIRRLPQGRNGEKQRLVGYVKALLDGALPYQRPDGLFHNVIDRPETFVETNFAQMLAYTIYHGMTEGWLSTQYGVNADRMREAARAKVDAFGFVRDVCGAPTFDRPGIAPEGQACFLLMETAAM
jgi:unsaturated rhamnogalacturonyl hydrolase